jgi:hypothetical protein
MQTTRRSAGRAAAAAGLLAAALAGCASARPEAKPPEPGRVGVRLMHLGHAVPTAVASAVRDPGVEFREQRVQAAAGPEGRAVLELPPGTWFVAARSEAPALVGWYGSNPVTVRAGEPLDVVLPAVPVPPPAVVEPVAPGEEGVSGEVVGEEGPVAAGVAFYLDASTQFRGPGYLEAAAGPDGRFDVRLSPGSYWLVARRRRGPEVFGPLEVGDVYGFYPGNPLRVRAGERVAVRLPTVRVLKKSGWAGPSTLRTRVAGTIRDTAGAPLAGYRAFLHAKPAMLGKPEFVSEPSGADGAYLIWVDREGTYYLGARAEIGRAREERERIGLYRGTPDHAVAVRLDGAPLPPLDVVVDEAPDGGAR